MDRGAFWELGGVADRDLQTELARLLAIGSRTEARIIAHLAAVEERRLHLEAGSSSLFDYCCRRLGLSENEAFLRITAARLGRRFPAIFGLIEQRALHLTAVCLLRDYLTPENHRELLGEASGKTKLEVLEMLARRFPRPDIASTIRKLPSPHARRLAIRGANAYPESNPAEVAQVDERAALGDNEPSSRTRDASTVPPPRKAVIEPFSATHYRIQLNASAELKRKLEHARDLLSHSNPSGDLAAVIERALDLLIVRVEKERFAQTKLRRRKRATETNNSDRGLKSSGFCPVGDHEALPAGLRKRIANDIKRQIVARDGVRCTFVGSDGQRCTASRFIQLHHEEPWARGGGDTPENLRMLCAGHNRLLAERDFGRERVAERIAKRRPGGAPTAV